jgi:hypothetical protein
MSNKRDAAASGSGTESDSDESIPELEDADKGAGQFPGSSVSLPDSILEIILQPDIVTDHAHGFRCRSSRRLDQQGQAEPWREEGSQNYVQARSQASK